MTTSWFLFLRDANCKSLKILCFSSFFAALVRQTYVFRTICEYAKRMIANGRTKIVYCTTRMDTKHFSHESEFGARRRRRVPQTLESEKCGIHSSCTVNFFYDKSVKIPRITLFQL